MAGIINAIEGGVSGVLHSVESVFVGSGTTQEETASSESVNRFDSFAPTRHNVFAKWYFDGKDYFYAVSEALHNAKQEILIEDWWLSPELYLRRPPGANQEFRLDILLKRKAEQGVKVRIVVYKELASALTLNSEHTQKTLEALHPNIVVQRHPDHGIEGTFLWAHHEKMCIVDREIAFLGGLDLCFGRYDTHNHELSDYGVTSRRKEVWPGQDYSNPRIRDFIDVQKWDMQLIDKKELARMPWHDVSVGITGEAVKDVAQHFVERWNFIKKEKSANRQEVEYLDLNTGPEKPQVLQQHPDSQPTQKQGSGHTCKVQVLRSSGKWSHGIETERSIQNAYIECIRYSKHFIYIENQFFITASEENENFVVKNRIGEEIVERIKRAYREGEKYRIIVSMPLIPAFPDDISSRDAGTVRLVMHWQYASICRGGRSIIEKLKHAGIDPDEYISFFSLRTHDRLNDVLTGDHFPDEVPGNARAGDVKSVTEPAVPAGPVQTDVLRKFVSEELYIHTKVMIIDDRTVICGSANLNDRSQMGTHDSEIAVIIEDTDMIPSKMNGQDYHAGKFAATLRRHLFKEHTGLLPSVDHITMTAAAKAPPHPHEFDHANLSHEDRIVEDPLSDKFYYHHWLAIANKNTEIFRELFHCVPDDNVTTWDEYKEFVPNSTKITTGHIFSENITASDIERKMAQVKGHLVHFPLQFLKNEVLDGGILMDTLTPEQLFT